MPSSRGVLAEGSSPELRSQIPPRVRVGMTSTVNGANVIPLVLSESFKKQIEHEGSQAFPNECCGIMIGRDIDGRRIVEKLLPVTNAFEEGEQYHRFSITPEQLMKADKAAGEEGKLVLGFYHSHPDHPARPSEYDRTHGWPFYSYVIVSIMNREPANMTCWVLDEVTEQFSEQPIVNK